ncbi:hypothetical protein MAALD49_07960 [Marinobacter shengliensis]|uniref:Uncharacterized protein n=1 Tax=Marinobacter nauticus TaxID=2743 RepID=A0A455W111_MARNT|nr:hypothetical protein YBY_06840 [Marinobacter nauticus]BEH13428.1 hypothetical protein MAALD49_07960 [Marinobacter shengliensis]
MVSMWQQKSKIRSWCKRVSGDRPPETRSFGTSMWRLGSAIHGSAQFREACPRKHAQAMARSSI